MALLDVVNMTDAQRDERRAKDLAAFEKVHELIADGHPRTVAITKAANALNRKREDVIAGYWRHVRREQAAPAPRRRKGGR